VLYRWGGTAAIVAGHLVAAQDTDAPWSVPVLCEAARQALDEDDGLLALACLRLAGLHRADLARRAEVQTALALVKWRLSPLSAETDVAELLTAAQDGNLSGADALSVARYLSWYGRPVEAGDMLNFAGESLAEADDEAASALYFTRAHLAYTYPGRFSRAWPAQAGRLSGLTSRQKLRIRFAGMVGSLLTQGFTRSVVHDAQAMLQHARLDDSTYESVMTALETLMHADCLHMAALWCDTLYAQAEERKVPTWCAQLSAIGAMICLRQDRLAEAERRGRAALSGNPKDLGIYIGFPLAVLCLAAVRSGQLDAARSYLGVPVPEAMFETPYGLHYLRARGKYHEARGADDSAIEDFSTCGRLMAEWGIDLPGIVPWRTDLAGVRLSVGRPARELVLEQLARLGNYNKRTQGISLRLLASTADLAQRPSILERAVEILQGSGSQLELSATLEDLSRAEQALNQYSKARAASRRAMHAASRGAADAAELEAQSPGRAVPLPAAVLSDAEQRVAELAAQGQTNRQIAGMLYITVSTVEQHLTRVYRKLRVKRRADLAQVLVTLVADNGGQPGQRPFSRALMFRLRCASAVSS